MLLDLAMTTRDLAAFGLPLLLAGVVVWALLARGDAAPTAREDSPAAACVAGADALTLTPGMEDETKEASTPPESPRLVGASNAAPAWPPPPAREPSCTSTPPGPKDRRRLTGLLVDAAGQPVPDAQVRLTDHRGEPVRSLYGVTGHTTTNVHGRYLLVTPTPGTYGASARVDGYGTGWTGPVKLQRTEPVEAPVLQLRGDGWFSGVVVFPNGRPAVGLEVRGYVDLRRGGSWGPSTHPGLVSIYTRTDEQGRFRIAGLRPGPYTARVNDTEAEPKWIHTTRGDEDLRFVVQQRQLRVLLRNAAGRPLEDALLDRYDPVRKATSRMNPPGAEICFYGEGGERFFLCAHADQCVPRAREVSIPTDAWTQEVTFVPHRPGKDGGRIALRVFDPDRGAVPRYKVTLRTPETGTAVPWLDEVRPDDGGMLHDVPPGTWRVVVEPCRPEEDVAHLFLFPSQTEVEVKAHATTPVDLTCRRGGRIRITSIWPDGLTVDQVESDMDLEGPVDAPPHYLWPDPSEPRLSPRLEPGRWVVVVHGEGLKTQRIPVQVPPGCIVDVEVRVAPD